MATQSIELPSGAIIEVQSVAASSIVGIEEASGVGDKVRRTWAEGIDLAAEMAGVVVEKIKASTAGVEEVAVEFGISFGGKTGFILVEGTTQANLKVSIKW